MSDSPSRLKTALAGRYEIERELGQGGMATVYLARDVRHHRLVAVKLLSPKLGAVLGGERFLSEIRVTATDRIDSTWEAQLDAHVTSIGAEAILVDIHLHAPARGDTALRAHYSVAYFARTRFRLGIFPHEVPDSTRDRLGSRYGVMVYERADDSPAGRAGIQSGDVLLQIGGEMLRSVPDFYRLLDQEEGKRVELMLDRGGRLIVKHVEIASLK